MTDAPAAPTDTAALQSKEMADSMAIFNEALAAHPPGVSNDATAPEPVVTKTEPTKVAPKVEPAKAAEPAPDAEFPDEVLSGKAAEPKPDPEAEEKADMKLISERPTGQIKHDHFETVQKAAQRRVDAANAKAAKHLADLETARKTAGKPSEEQAKEFELTRKERDALRDELMVVAYERTPEFKEKFTDKEATLIRLAEEQAKEFGIDAKVIKNALSASGKQRFEILENAGELPASALSYLSNILAKHDELMAEKVAALSQGKERYAAYLQQQKAVEAQQMEQRKAIEKQTFEQARANLAEKFPLFRPAQEGTKFQARQAEALAKAEAYFFNGSIPDIELAEVAYKASMFDEQNRWLDHVTKERNAFREKIAELTAANPGVNGNGHRANLNDDMAGLTEEQRSMRIFEESRRAHGLM